MPKTDPIQIPLEVLDKASTKLSSFKQSLDTMAVSAAAIGMSLKKGFEFSEYGAGVMQTSESFDLLLNKLGVAPGLLQDLDAAAGGTISQMQLMSSTATLLAGTSGELGSSLANATPELIEIARAANKLNPSLGTTTHMYESLAMGIKRSSPLILDNLGLTIKIGDANQKFAESIGKTVEQLTAEEKQQALLNETLRAGQVLIEQVGGSTDSATDAYNKFTTSTQEAKDALAEGTHRIFEPTIASAAEFVNSLADVLDAENQIKQAYEDGIITLAERNQLINDATWTSYTFAEALDVVNQREQMAAIEAQGWAAAQMVVNQNLADGSSALNIYSNDARMAQEAQYDLVDATESVKAAQDATNESLTVAGQKYSNISTNVYSLTQSLQDQLDFLTAGGGALLELAQTAETALDEGNFAGAQEALNAAAEGAVDLDLELGKIDPEEAIQRLMDLGLGPDEARAKVEEFEASLFRLTTQDWVVRVDVHYNTTGDPPGIDVPTGGGGGPGGGGPGSGDGSGIDSGGYSVGFPSAGGYSSDIFIDTLLIVASDDRTMKNLIRDAASAKAGASGVNYNG